MIKQAIAPCMVQSASTRRLALRRTPAQVPPWYAAATDSQKKQLKVLLDARCESLNAMDTTLGKLQTVQEFCQPLLEAALKKAGYPLDVNRVWLRLYSPVADGFGVTTAGFKVKTFSLLQAGLNNFDASETAVGFFNAASGFITEPDARGHFERHTTALKIEDFVKLCRELDLGAQYQAHLKGLLYPAQALAEGVWRERYLRYQKDAFLAAAYMALLKADIDATDHALLLRVAAGERRIMLGDKQIWYRIPCLMNLHLHDCLLIEPCVKNRYSDEFIAYIPDDPEHPIKRYATFSEFQNALSRRLKTQAIDQDRAAGISANEYQRFISRFIAYKDRPYYFRRLTELVVDAPPQPFAAQWLRSEWGKLVVDVAAPRLSPVSSLLGDPQPKVRVPVTDPNFAINAYAIDGLWTDIDVWSKRYESWRARLLADARAQAIPTADADASARGARLQHYLNIGLFAVNLLAIALPPLGAIMSVVMVGQMLYEVLDGVVELSEGDREAGWAHIGDVLENMAQLAAGAAVFHFTVSPFIESLKAVQLPSGKTRLWKPDLTAYAHDGPLPSTRTVDERGLQQVGDRRYLMLEGRRYGVVKDPQTEGYFIEHPTRADAYRPSLVENGSGAWNHELERPLTWQGLTLMRRLGPVAEGFSDAQLEQIRHVSGIEEDWLRRIHVEGEPIPAILLDTFQRFRAYDQAIQVSHGIGAGALSDSLCGYAASITVELPNWPRALAIEAFTGEDLSGASVKYGNVEATGRGVLVVSRNELMTGQLPRRILEFLDEGQIDQLIGRQTPPHSQARIAAVQKMLQARAAYCRSRIMRSLYESGQPLADAAVARIQRAFEKLPTLIVQELLTDISEAERRQLYEDRKIPLRVGHLARRSQQRYRMSQAYAGLYLEAIVNKDTEALVLNSLENLPGWTDNLRLEVREGGLTGELRAAFGEVSASDLKTLVRIADGQYQAFDSRGQELHGINGLYGSLQHALPDAHRNAIGLFSVGQGDQLRARLLDNVLPWETLRRLLRMQPERRAWFTRPHRLSGGRLGYPLSGGGKSAWRQIIEERVKNLYDTMSPEQIDEFLRSRSIEDDRWLKALEAEFKQLDNVLNRWLVEGPRDREALRARRAISDTLKYAWKKCGVRDLDMNSRYRGERIVLKKPGTGAQLETLPPLPGNFDHVTSVHIINCGLTDQGTRFLTSFRKLRILNLEGNQLTYLPEALADLPFLEGLDLSDNQIVLTQETALQIRGLRFMEWMALSGNPLSQPVDISRMPGLRWLYLSGCGLQEWPVGIFASPRPREFVLELTGNRLTAIPDVAPGSERAKILARTAVTRDWLAPQVLEKLKLYLESVGFDPNRRLPPRGAQDSANWMAGLTQLQWVDLQPVWNSLEEAPGSEPFFDELRALSDSSDAKSPAYRADLTAKVWRMLEAMAEDAALSEHLFEMAIAPATCVDAIAQLFNTMGFEVLLYEAQSLSDPALLRLELLELTKSRVRLDELGRIANETVSQLLEQGRMFPEYDERGLLITRRDAQGNARRSIDEVEIHLAYATQLAARLELPWQSQSMMFEEPDVTPSMVEAAYQRIKALDQGDAMRNAMVEQPFWESYLQGAFAEAFESFDAKSDALIDLQATQRQLADNGALSAQQKTDLLATISDLELTLGKAAAQMVAGDVMTEDEFSTQSAQLGEERKNVMLRLTDQILGRSPQIGSKDRS